MKADSLTITGLQGTSH